MKRPVRVDQREDWLEMTREGIECRFRYGPGPEQTAVLQQVEAGVYLVLIEGRAYEAKIEPGPDCLYVAAGGRRFAVQVRDPRAWTPNRKGLRGGERVSLTAPMPGKVVRLLAAQGDRVETGQGILVLEAMKMQNEVKTPRSGIVASLKVQTGDAVGPGQVLAVIE
ncbi:MAG: biotin/lipoyl-binding protein [Bryobacterales bacterium]|nr:biotin/lipoyl-binding protein [Bryobacterales bacterium]